MDIKRSYSVILYSNPFDHGPHHFDSYRFDYMPVLVEITDERDKDREDPVIKMSKIVKRLGYRPIHEKIFAHLTIEIAQQARDRIMAAVNGARGDQEGPVLSELSSDDNSTLPFPYCRRGKRNSPEHRDKISRKLKGRKHSESRNKKISETMKGRPQPKKKGNQNRAKSYILISPSGSREMIYGLKNACSQRNLNPSNMVQVARGVRSHHKQWCCVDAEIFDWK